MILITGSEGFIGSHLCNKLKDSNTENVIASFYTSNKKETFGSTKMDLRNSADVKKTLKKYKPSTIINLGAQSLPELSWNKIRETFDTNLLGTVNLIESVSDLKLNTRIFLASTSAQYGLGLPQKEIAVDEEAPQKPVHPYGISKMSAEITGKILAEKLSIDIVFGRIFNTSGKNKTGDVWGDWAQQIRKHQQNSTCELKVGNLDNKRAYLHVDDTISAILDIINHGKSLEAYNISGDSLYSGYDIISAFERVSNIKIKPKCDESKKRFIDEPVIYGNTQKLKCLNGWKAIKNIDDIAYDHISS